MLVLTYALFPVLWILSLSLKPTSTVKDGKLIPSQITFDNYNGIFRGDMFSLGAEQLARHRADHHGDRGGYRWHGRVCRCATDLPR